jgi:hypothetical protein
MATGGPSASLVTMTMTMTMVAICVTPQTRM